MIKRSLPAILICGVVLGLLLIETPPTYASRIEAPILSPTPQYPPPGIEAEIKQAILAAIASEVKVAPVYLFVETEIDIIAISRDGNWAAAQLIPIDPQTRQLIPTEPGLAVVNKHADHWQAILPSDPDWLLAIQNAPFEILTEEQKSAWLQVNAEMAALIPLATLSGYYLPWRIGITLALTQSVGHDRYTPSGNAHYAFDFATPGTAQMFDLLAAKSGTVKQAKDTCDNGSETCANWLVLEDTTTNPVTYQLYLHLAKNSIPAELHTIGRFVRQGEFIGIADDTGNSTGHHLHFMVHTNPYSYWGTSVDITFNEVTINGGRPRILSDKPYCKNDTTYHDVCDSFSNLYVSQNHLQGDQTPPYGDILDPLNGITVESNILRLEGWANDDQSGLSSAQFIAKYNDSWQSIGSPFSTNLFSINWDLCSAGVPDGAVDLALEIRDNAGNLASALPGLRHFIKNFDCPAPPQSCIPESNQVALYRESDFQGYCQVFNSGNYSSTLSMATIGDDQTSSVMVGSNVIASLFLNNNFKGRGETFINSDSNLVDNLIGAKTTSALIVRSRNTTPGVPSQIWPDENFTFHPNATVSLVGDNSGGATEFRAKITKPGGSTEITAWQKYPIWLLGSLSAGNYSWQIKARNNYAESSWSSSRTFSVSPSEPIQPATITAPFSDDIEGDPIYWIRSPYWDRTLENNHTPSGSISWKYDTNVRPEDGYDIGQPNSGDLTSVPIQIPEAGDFQLRFWYYYETETRWRIWDQRWLQIAENGNPFVNVYQFSEDPPDTWLQSPPIDLKPYTGKTIQFRFHFETLDKNFNRFKGWYIDDVAITIHPPSLCNPSNEPDNTPQEATHLTYNASVSGLICPGGDIDYYTFQGNAGDQVGINVYAQSTYPDSKLDSYLTLFDTDNASPLAENDDQVLGLRTDSHISYVLPRDGSYLLSVHAWDHPSAGGNDYFYTISLFNDNTDPTASFQYPFSGSILPNTQINLSLAAQDDLSGISHVLFYWHSSDWKTENWKSIGSDWDGRDGWGIGFDLSTIGFQTDMAFYAQVYDQSGNWRGVASWNLKNPAAIFYFPLVTR